MGNHSKKGLSVDGLENPVPASVSVNREPEQAFGSFFNHLPGFAWMKDVGGRYVFANSAVQRLEQFQNGWLGKTDRDLWEPEIAEAYRANDRLVIMNRKPLETLEPCFINGEQRYVFVTKFPIMDPAGEVIMVGGTSYDVTDRTKAEKRLREYERVIESLEEMIVVVDRNYRYQIVNEAFLSYRGLYRKEVIGRLVSEVLDPVVFETVVRPKLDECFQGKVVTYELTYNYGKLGQRDLLISYFPVEGPQGIDRAACVLRDITDDKRAQEALRVAEQKYHDIFENAGEGIFQSTPEGQYIAANPALARMHGFDSPADLIRERRDISRDAYVDPTRREEFKRLLEANGVVREFEHQIVRRNGTKIWASINARAVRDELGVIRYYEGTAQDISERKRAESRSAAFASLARKLSGVSTQLDAGRIIAETAKDLFEGDACNLDLYDKERDLIYPMLSVDTIDGQPVDVTPSVAECQPTARSRRIIESGPSLMLRDEPIEFEADAVPFGDTSRPSASIMTVPVRHASKVIGLLSIQSYSLRAYDQAALRDLEALADHCGEALNRVHAEQSLRESEERFRQMAEHFEDVIWIADKNLERIIYVNQAYEAIFGRSCESLCKRLKSFVEAVHPDDRASVDQMLERERLGDHEPFEYRIVRPDGAVRWIERRSFPICDDHGQVLRMAGIGQDITDRKRAETDLRQSEERYRDLVENSRELICTHDLNGSILSANRMASEVLGYDLNEFCQMNFCDLLPPELRHQFAEYLERIRRDGVATGLTLVQTKSGEHRVLEYHNTVRTEGVTAPIVRGMARDITEQRRAEKGLRASEERYRELFENAKDAIYVHDLSGRYMSINRAAEELSGYRREEIIGKHFSTFIAPENLREVRENICKKLDDAGETAYEVDIISRDRRRVPVEIVSRLIFENGAPVGIQGTARDMTERKRAQEALRTYSQSLIDAQEAERQHIARELHDEIGQILTAIRINLQSVQRSCQTNGRLQQVDEGIAIVDEALTRVRELSLELRPSLLDDLGLAAALRWYVDRYAQRTGIVAEVVNEFEHKGRLPRELETVCFRIAQEALTNVARHAQAQHLQIEVRRRSQKLYLAIKDDGVGFDVKGLVGQASSSASLGLRGMRERARAVHGVLEIDSTLNAGTLVYASFPLNREN